MSNSLIASSMAQAIERVYNALDGATSGVSDPEDWLIEILEGGNKTKSGVNVTPYTAMGFPPVWYAVNKIAGHIGSMPLTLRRRVDPQGSLLVVDDPRVRLMERPNEYQSSMIFREQMQAHTLLVGNGRAWIERDSAKNPIGLIPLLPEVTSTVLYNGEKWHTYTSQNSWDYDDKWEGGKTYWIRDEDVLHIPGLGWNGVWGYSLIHIAREAIGLGIAGQMAAAYSFTNNGRPGIILEAPPGKFRDPQKAKQLVETFDQKQTGIDNAGKTALLREGVTAKVLPISASDAQFLQQRGFQREDTALLFLLETILGDKSGATYKSITERQTAYMVNCLSRWVTKWEEECNEKLRTEREKQEGSVYWKFDTREMLSGDPNSLADYTSKLRLQGAISGNEVRQMHRLNIIDDPVLNSYLNPQTTAGQEMANAPDSDDNMEEQKTVEDKFTKIARNAVGERMRVMLATEKKRVLAIAGNKPDFPQWLNQFYSQWEASLGDTVEAIGASREIAVDHCKRSHGELSQIAAIVAVDQLADNVATCLAKWDSRAETLTEAILSGACTND